MPAKKTPAPKKPATTKVKKTAVVASTPVRYSALPKLTTPAAKVVVTDDMIARKAFELFAAGRGGSELDHWFAAEAELRQAA
jgi:hypothetical protein